MRNVLLGLVLALVSMIPLVHSLAQDSALKTREVLENHVGKIKGTKENIVTKRNLAIDLCDKLNRSVVLAHNGRYAILMGLLLINRNHLSRK